MFYDPLYESHDCGEPGGNPELGFDVRRRPLDREAKLDANDLESSRTDFCLAGAIIRWGQRQSKGTYAQPRESAKELKGPKGYE